MAAGEIRKTYLALVRGRVDAPRVIESGIRRKEASVILRVACPIGEGDLAKTELIPLAYHEELSLVRLIPHTGRTHQLRVHMALIGHPLLGAELYGDGGGMGRHALHAATLSFPAPRGEGTVSVCAPLPADMREKIESLGEEAIRLAKAECGETG
jgi:23S rRNA pseudouridine1911/1915/1917 synthase